MKNNHDIPKQAVAAAALLDALAVDGDDFKHDVVEGETDFFEAVERALDEIRHCDVVIAGIDHTTNKLAERKSRVKRRVERLKGLIDQSFQMAEIKSHVFPCETVSVRRVPAKLIVTDESEIPSEFFEPQPPKLDRKKLTAAVKDGEVSGATLSNGGSTIQIRRA